MEALINLRAKIAATTADRIQLIASAIELALRFAQITFEPKTSAAYGSMDQVHADFNRQYETVGTGLQHFNEELLTIKEETANAVAFGNCKAPLQEYAQFQRFMSDWKGVADTLPQYKQCCLALKKSRFAMAIIDDLPEERRLQPAMLDKKQALQDQIEIGITRACTAHHDVLKALGDLVGRMRKRDDRSAMPPSCFQWENAQQYHPSWQLISATIGALCATASSLYDQIEQVCSPVTDRLMPRLTDSGFQNEHHASQFAQLRRVMQLRIDSHDLYKRVVDLVSSSASLRQYWQTRWPDGDLSADKIRQEMGASYQKFNAQFKNSVVYDKIICLAALCDCHDTHLKRMHDEQDAEANVSVAADSSANAGPSSSESNDLAQMRKRDIDTFLHDAHTTTTTIKDALAAGNVATDTVTKLESVLVGISLLAAPLYVNYAITAYEAFSAATDEIFSQTAAEPESLLRAAKLCERLHELFHHAADALHTGIPGSIDAFKMEKLDAQRRILINLVQMSSRSFPAMLKVVSIPLTSQDGATDSRRQILASHERSCKLVREIANMMAPATDSDAWLLFEKTFFGIALFDADNQFSALQEAVKNASGDVSKLRQDAIALACREQQRCLALLAHFEAKRNDLVRQADRPSSQQSVEELQQSVTIYTLGATSFSKREGYLRVDAVLEAQPALQRHSDMLNEQGANLYHEAKRLLSEPAPPHQGVIADTTLKLIDDLSQLMQDTELLHIKISRETAKRVPAQQHDAIHRYLHTVRAGIERVYLDTVEWCGIDPDNIDRTRPSEEESAAPLWPSADAVLRTAANAARDDAAEMAPDVLPPAERLTAPQLAELGTKIKQRDERIQDYLRAAESHIDFAKELEQDRGNPAYIRKWYQTASRFQEQAAVLIDLNEAARRLLSSGSAVPYKRHKGRVKASTMRVRAMHTAQLGEASFRRLTKARALPYNIDLRYVLNENQIQGVGVGARLSYVPFDARTGKARVDEKGRTVTNWMQELTISLRPDGGETYPHWIVHVHFPTRDSQFFTMAHAKTFEDRQRGAKSGPVARHYVSHDIVKRLFEWRSADA